MDPITHTFISQIVDTADERGLNIYTATAYHIGKSRGITLDHLDKAYALAIQERLRRKAEVLRAG
jgi:hypothetical protein